MKRKVSCQFSKNKTVKQIVSNELSRFIESGFIIEEQKSENQVIKNLLQKLYKVNNAIANPAFIISSKQQVDLLIIVEYRPIAVKAVSKIVDQFENYTVNNEALIFSSYLSKKFDVITLILSGEDKEEFSASSYLQLKNSEYFQKFPNRLFDLLYLQEKYLYHEDVKKLKYAAILEYSKNLNQKLYNRKIQEDKRSLLITGILIALKNDLFRANFAGCKTAKQLTNKLVDAAISQLQDNIPNVKLHTLKNVYSFIKTHQVLSTDREFFVKIIQEVDENINSFVQIYRNYDIFGEFYIEFLRYANNDKGLGIVLTPRHITELFVDLAKINKDSVVFDNCCGVGGFLMSAMSRMIGKIRGNRQKEREIIEKQIIGIEFQDNIFPLVCSNMIISGDGRVNIFNENCLSANITKIRKNFKPNVGFLNPPFKINKDDVEEIEFVLNNLEGLEVNGICIALLPIQCCLAQRGDKLLLKQKIFKNHTIEAVISLPRDIFYNSKVEVITCAVVIRAHQPHPLNYKTYFGYWKDDGFIKRKNKGRIDTGRWNSIRKRWVDSYMKKQHIPGLSVMHTVKAEDEWCVENYMETDYIDLKSSDFVKKIHQFSSYQFYIGKINNATNSSLVTDNISLSSDDWKWFSYGLSDGIFDIQGGYYNKKPDGDIDGELPFIGASASNNGVTSWHHEKNVKKIFAGNCITITNNGSVGYAYYQPYSFICSHDVTSIRLKYHEMNPYIAMFLCVLIEKERYRWDYGRKWRPVRMSKSLIKLPVNNVGHPDWRFMENYIKNLPYSKNL